MTTYTPRSPRTVQLAKSILENVIAVEDYLEVHGHPSRSFEPSAASEPPIPPPMAPSVDEVLAAIEELTALLLGPMGWLGLQLGRSFDMVSLHAMHRFQVAQQFSVGDNIPVTELAKRCGVDAEAFGRLMQHAVTKRFIAQPDPGFLAHTAFSAMLAISPAINDWVGYTCEDMRPASTRLVDAITKWPGPPWLPNQTGYNLATGTSETFFDSLARDKAKSKRFASSMGLMQRFPGWEPAPVLEIFGWGTLNANAVVVDVGGGDGTFALALAQRHPNIRSIVTQDIPEVVKQAQASIPEHLRGVIKPEVHNFFKPQPVKGAAVYFLRKILHDWPDEHATKILKQLIPALTPGARVLINDHCLSPPGTMSPWQEWRARGQDLAMMTLFNSKERTREQWIELIGKADPRFSVKLVTAVATGPLALIEVVWQ